MDQPRSAGPRRARRHGWRVPLVGRTKVQGLLSVTDAAVSLFEDEHRLPLLAPDVAAHLAACAEHAFPVLLVLGFGTRLSAAALLGMTLVIQLFVYPAFFPPASQHRLGADEADGADLVCASVEFGASFGNPLVHGLPPLLVLPLREAPAMRGVPDALFTEAFDERSGRDAALNRLSEVVLVYLLRHAIEYLAGWRLSVAQGLLTQGRQVKSIADEVGYGSPNALTRAFTQRLGQTPTGWLAQRIGRVPA